MQISCSVMNSENMHQNPIVPVKAIVDRIERNGLSVSKEQILALRFMQNKEFIKVKQCIEKNTRIQIKASFTQGLIDSLLVLDVKISKLVAELISKGQLENELEDDELPWEDGDIKHSQINRKPLLYVKPYRRDNKDVLATPPSKKSKLLDLTPLPLHRIIETKPFLEKSTEYIYTLTDEQVNDLVKTGTSTSISKVLRDSTINLTEEQSLELRKQLKARSSSPQLPERKGTIEIREGIQRVRLNQAAFRDRVLCEYNYQCAITEIAITAILEAAHVIPADGDNDRVDNSLLLSKNMHGLFDRFLISINPDTSKLELAPSIRGKGLDDYQDKFIKHSLSKESLRWHYSQFKADIFDP